MKANKKRLQQLEKANEERSLSGVDEQECAVIILDKLTGQPLNPIPPNAKILAFLPDNGRGDCTLIALHTSDKF